MSEALFIDSAGSEEARQIDNRERWKNLIVFLVLVNTLLVAAVAGLQVDANIRTSLADSQSQYNAILASGEVLRSSIQGTYDLDTYAQALVNQQQALVLEYTALKRDEASDPRGSHDLNIESAASQARADQAKALSVLLTDPRYAPATQFDSPNSTAYLQDMNAAANSLVEKQNAAADSYLRWNSKADSYVAVLTILAVAFFLLGVAQSVSPRLRLMFCGIALVVMTLGSLWGLIVLIR